MDILKCIYDELKDVYGCDVSIRALCVGGGALLCSGGFALLLISLLLKPQQPVIIINEPLKIEDNK